MKWFKRTTRRGLPVELTEQLIRETTAERPVLVPYKHPPASEWVEYDQSDKGNIFIRDGVNRRITNLVNQQFIAERLFNHDEPDEYDRY